MKNYLWAVVLSCSLFGCGLMMDSSIRKGNAVSDQITLGSTKAEVLSLLNPIQSSLPAGARKSSERFLKDGKEIFVYFLRTGRQPDGLTTDDEFTPYVFENDKLIGIGWSLLGGPKTHGQIRPPDTNINVKQETTIH